MAVWVSSIVWKPLSAPLTTPIGLREVRAAVTSLWVDCSMSSFLNSTISDAWIAVPRAESSDGLSAVVSVAGVSTATESGNRAVMREVI